VYNGLTNGLTYQFKFEKGVPAANRRELGSEITAKSGYVLTKVSDKGGYHSRWKLKHIHLWESLNGPIPKNHCIIFADGDTGNFEPENLVLVSRAEIYMLRAESLRSASRELTKAGVSVARLILKAKERMKAI
jgi:hypothetical protein